MSWTDEIFEREMTWIVEQVHDSSFDNPDREPDVFEVKTKGPSLHKLANFLDEHYLFHIPLRITLKDDPRRHE